MNWMLTNQLISWPASQPASSGDQTVSLPSPVSDLQACSATPGFSFGCWEIWNQILMITQQALYPSCNLSSFWTKYAVQDPWQGTIFVHLTSTVEKPPVLPKWWKNSISQKETRAVTGSQATPSGPHCWPRSQTCRQEESKVSCASTEAQWPWGLIHDTGI